MKTQYVNAKPSEVSNLGEEVLGAARHRNDTYDNPEAERVARAKKQSAKDLKALRLAAIEGLKVALSESTEAAKLYLQKYELDRCIISHPKFASGKSLQDLKAIVLAETDRADRESMRKLFNLAGGRIHKIKYMRPILVSSYFDTKTKDHFRESNGRTAPWSTPNLKLSSETRQAVLNVTRAVQFGNSIPDSERDHVIYSLNLGLNWLKGMLPNFDYQSLAFSFGARGNAKSVAYYQASNNLISVNRHNEGSVVHEIGHAIDAKLGCRFNIPSSIRERYVAQVRASNFSTSHKAYLCKSTEIFARLFESYVWTIAKEKNLFMIFIDSTCPSIPVMDAETLEFMKKELSSISK
jgi:hypothetical protein